MSLRTLMLEGEYLSLQILFSWRCQMLQKCGTCCPSRCYLIVTWRTMNLYAVLNIQAAKIGSGTVLSQIISLVETAQMSRAPIQKFGDYLSYINCLRSVSWHDMVVFTKSWSIGK